MANRIEIIIDSVTKGLETGIGKTTTSFGKFRKAALGVGAVLAGGVAVGLDKSIKAALNAEAANTRLATAFKNVGLNAKDYGKAIDKAESSGRKLGFTDEETATSLGSLVTATRSVSAASKDLAVAQDVARFKHVSLTDATKMLTMAMTGSQRAAKQLGISVQPVTTNFDALAKSATSAEKAHAKFLDKQATGNAVIDAVNAHLHGQAEAFAGTAAGGMAQFSAQLDHLEVALGTALLPALQKVTEAAAGMTEWLGKHTTLAKILGVSIAALAAGLISLSVAQWAFNVAAAANPYVALAIGIAALAAGLVILNEKYKIVTRAVDYLKDHLYLLLAVPVVGQTAFVAAEIIKNWNMVKNVAGGAIGAVTSMVNALKSAFGTTESAGSSAARGINAAWNAVEGGIKGTLNAIRAVANDLAGAFNAVEGAAKTVVARLGGKFPVPALGPIIAIFNALESAVMAVVRAVETLISALSHIHVPSIHVPKLGILGHATGGVISAGTPSLVGERGPEIFTPSGSGSVTPNSKLGGASQIVVPLVIDGTVLASVLIDPLRNQAQLIKQRTGKPAFA